MVLAHRGDHTRARENTAASFEAARSAGADGVELDVRRSADGVLIVHHDSSADGIGVLVHAAFEAIRSTLPWVPTLDEALDACVGLSLVNIEIKNLPTEPDFDPTERVTDAVVDRLSRRRTSVDPVVDSVVDPAVDPAVVISSFNVPTLERVREIDRSIDTAWLTLPDLEPLAAVRAAAHRDLQGVHVAHRALSRADVPGVVGRARDLGVALRPWTVNDAGEIRRFVAAGVDAVITDRPSAAVALRDAVAADASSGE